MKILTDKDYDAVEAYVYDTETLAEMDLLREELKSLTSSLSLFRNEHEGNLTRLIREILSEKFDQYFPGFEPPEIEHQITCRFYGDSFWIKVAPPNRQTSLRIMQPAETFVKKHGKSIPKVKQPAYE